MTPIKSGIFLFILTLCLNLNGQNLVGYNAKEIRQHMKDKQKEFIFQNMIMNNTFKYLKYQNRNETQTLLFFLTSDSICKMIRLISDKSMVQEKINELNSKYSRSGNNLWNETRDGKKYKIELKDEEWSFNVTYSLDN